MALQPRKTQGFRVLHSSDELGGLDVRFRTSTKGPELELVENFLQKTKFSIPAGLELTIFREPLLESGAPDVVGVVWDPKTADRWNKDRRSLSKFELRLIHYLMQTGASSISSLETIFYRSLSDALRKLEAVDMIRRKGDIIMPRSMSSIYATRHIFAIEAKISEWQGALSQACRNRWFATSSHILIPRIPNNGRVQSEAKRLNVGVLTSENFLDLKQLILARTPESYCSWLFNEWAWRADLILREYAQSSSKLDTSAVS